jgi:hypothetical protein
MVLLYEHSINCANPVTRKGAWELLIRQGALEHVVHVLH